MSLRLAVDARGQRVSRSRAKQCAVLLRAGLLERPVDIRRSIHAPARHDQLAPGAPWSWCTDDDGVGRGREPQNRRERAARLARSFGLGLEPTCTAKTVAALSTVTARAGDNQRCKLQLHRRGTYLYWHTLSAVPHATSHAAAHEALPHELADPARAPSSNPS
jgi:hypothetical protein